MCIKRQGPGTIAVRPERMRFVPAGEAVLSGTIESANFLGGHVLYRVAAGAKLLVRETGAPRPVGTAVGVTWSAADAVALEDCGVDIRYTEFHSSGRYIRPKARIAAKLLGYLQNEFLFSGDIVYPIVHLNFKPGLLRLRSLFSHYPIYRQTI
jgi:hypothetical protein